MSVTKLTPMAMVLAMLSCAPSFGQSADPLDHRQTFHVHGTVSRTDDGSFVPGVRVEFEGEKTNKTVSPDQKGRYEAELPVGLYTMTVQPLSPALLIYKRPLFRVATSTNIVFDVFLDAYEKRTCEITNPPPGNQISDRDRVKNACGGLDMFPLPSEDGAFQLLIRFGNRKPTDSGYVYSAPVDLSALPEPSYVYRNGRNPPTLGPPVFVAYNLFTLRADHVIYDERNRTLRAKGNVVVAQADGATQRADSMIFKLENGQASLLLGELANQ